jgi:hypothetical protein
MRVCTGWVNERSFCAPLALALDPDLAPDLLRRPKIRNRHEEKRCLSPRTLILTFSLREKELARWHRAVFTEARGLTSLSLRERAGVRVTGLRTK